VRIDLKTSLTGALGITAGDLVSIVGAGGKTSLMYGLGRELAAAGNKTLLTTTTRILYPRSDDAPVVVLGPEGDSMADEIGGRFGRTNLVLAGREKKEAKILGFAPAFVDRLRVKDPALTIVAECDGARGKSLKVPEDHEPPVATSTSVFVVVVGADSFHRPLDSEAVYNPERVAAVAGVGLDAEVSEPVIIETVVSPESYLGRMPAGARLCVVINKVASDRLDQYCFRGGGSVLSIGLGLKAHDAVDTVMLGSLRLTGRPTYLVLR
jgi:probable selenium-dependent hydroxylase accessory protein YqeC